MKGKPNEVWMFPSGSVGNVERHVVVMLQHAYVGLNSDYACWIGVDLSDLTSVSISSLETHDGWVKL